jgi:hypothetical protein
MEWWEVLAAWQTVNNQYKESQNRINNVSNERKLGGFEKDAKGKIEYKPVSHWRYTGNYSEKVGQMREKILNGLM